MTDWCKPRLATPGYTWRCTGRVMVAARALLEMLVPGAGWATVARHRLHKNEDPSQRWGQIAFVNY